MLSRGILVEVRRQALRKRCWYRVLDNLERGILNLTVELLDVVHSSTLLDQVVTIVAKLRCAFKSSYARHFEAYGLRRLGEVVDQARMLCYSGVDMLERDNGFKSYLMFLGFYQPLGWRLYPRL
jgi:hypothetical protein